MNIITALRQIVSRQRRASEHAQVVGSAILAADTSEVRDNLMSLEAMWQAGALDDYEAWLELMRRAQDGQEVYAYKPAASADWVVWVATYPWLDARWLPNEWASEYKAGRCQEVYYQRGDIEHV